MSGEDILMSLIPELEAIRHGDCVWCRRGEPHPEYSQCPCKSLVPVRAGAQGRTTGAQQAA